MGIEKYKMKPEDLTWKADLNELNYFKTTEDIVPPEQPIDIVKGQGAAKETITRAIESRRNVLLMGPAGCGKSLLANTVAIQYSDKKAKNVQLYDQVLTHNFMDEFEPVNLALPTPMGQQFKSDLAYLMRIAPSLKGSGFFIAGNGGNILDTPITGNLRKTMSSRTSYKVKLGNLIESANKQNGYKPVKKYKEKLEECGGQFLDVPIMKLDGHTYSLRQIFPELKVQQEAGFSLLGSMMGGAGAAVGGEYQARQIIDKYKKHPKAAKQLEEILREFIDDPNAGKSSFLDAMQPDKKFEGMEYTAKIIVDNSDTKGLPIQYIENPSVQNLMGEAGHDAYNMKPPHTRCQAGKLHKADGGVVIIDELITVLQDEWMRNYLLTVLQEKQGRIGGGGGRGGGTSAGIETQPVNADCIVIGSANEDIMKYMTPKIARRFQYKVTLDSSMDNTEENRQGYAQFVRHKVIEYNEDPKNVEKIPHFSPGAVAAVIERGVRLAQNVAHGKDKLTNILDPVGQLVVTTGLVAYNKGKDVASEDEVAEAIKETTKITGQMQQNIMKNFDDNLIKISTDGDLEGVVNGLVVMQNEFGLFSFGFPSRIIATESEGCSPGIRWVDDEAGLGKQFYKKANSIIQSYLNQRYTKKKMDNVAMSVSFAQSYNEVDGDSATTAILTALTSKLADMPVSQNYAITGSANELGQVQPIGGVNEKVEGFYDVCKQRGLNGEQGVIIPESNAQDLLIKDEILEDVKAGKFNIYKVSQLDEVFEILLGADMETIDKKINEKLSNYESSCKFGITKEVEE